MSIVSQWLISKLKEKQTTKEKNLQQDWSPRTSCYGTYLSFYFVIYIRANEKRSSSLIKTHIPTSAVIKTHTQVIALMKAHTRSSGERQVPAPRLQQTIRISTDFHVHGSRAHAREPTRICACNCFKPFSLLHPQHPLTVPSSLISRSVLVNSCPCQDVHVSHPFRFSFF